MDDFLLDMFMIFIMFSGIVTIFSLVRPKKNILERHTPDSIGIHTGMTQDDVEICITEQQSVELHFYS